MLKSLLTLNKNKLLSKGLMTIISLTIVFFLWENVSRALTMEMPVHQEILEKNNLDIYEQPTFEFAIGDSHPKLNQPMGVTTDHDGNIYVADSGNSDLKVYSARGQFLYSFNERNNSDSKLSYPYGLMVWDDENLLIGDAYKHTIEIFSKDGKYLKNFIPASRNIKPGNFYKDSEGNLYIIDLNQNQILVYDNEGKERAIKSSEFSFIQGVVKDRKGNLIIANSGLNEVLFLNRKGQLIKTETGKTGDNPDFSMIRGMAVDNLDRLLVSDTLINRIRFFDLRGKELFYISSANVELGSLQFPVTIHTTPEGKIFVVDRGNNRVLVWTNKVKGGE